jgi:uncharacterized RDD family membrane protein YckC
MQCPKCGAQNVSHASYCSGCGCQLSETSQTTYKNYAGFWKRVGAAIIDSMLLSIISGVCVTIIIMVLGGAMMLSTVGMNGLGAVSYGVTMAFAVFTFGSILNWLYFTLMESSAKQATLGKMALGIVVTDDAGARISFARANVRYWSKFLSALFLCVGYMMAGFTAKKQALHDLVASTLVVDS